MTPEPLQDDAAVVVLNCSQDANDRLERCINDIAGAVCAGVAKNYKELEALAGSAEHLRLFMVEICPGNPKCLGHISMLCGQFPGVPVLVYSHDIAASVSLIMNALSIGAKDSLYMPEEGDGAKVQLAFQEELTAKVQGLCGIDPARVAVRHKKKKEVEAAAPADDSTEGLAIGLALARYPALPPKAIAIGSSTGGPQALLSTFESLKGRLPDIPIFITQHMPPVFTASLAEHLTQVSGRVCREPKEGEPVTPQSFFIAPGDYHMVLAQKEGGVTVHLNQNEPENFCRPAVDVMLRSLVPIYGSRLLVMIFTGMGQDGLKGARLARERQATIVAQDKKTSAVWGMPRAVAKDGICDAVLPLPEMGRYLLRACGGEQ